MALGKKGQFGDSLMTAVSILLLIIIAYAFYLVFDAMGDSPAVSGNPITNNINEKAKDLYQGIDFAVPGIILALNIGSLISLFFLKSHPILSFVFIIMLPITILVAAGVSNSFEDITATNPSIAVDFPISTYVMDKLPLLLFGLDILGGILLFTVML